MQYIHSLQLSAISLNSTLKLFKVSERMSRVTSIGPFFQTLCRTSIKIPKFKILLFKFFVEILKTLYSYLGFDLTVQYLFMHRDTGIVYLTIIGYLTKKVLEIVGK